MRKNKKIKIILIIIILCFCVILVEKKSEVFKDLYDDMLFLKNIQKKIGKDENLNTEQQKDYKKNKVENKEEKVKTNISEYLFNINSNNMDSKSINLLDTLNEETLINKKIFPGLEGMFNIVLSSKQDVHYKITFQSENVKPANLKFQDMDTKVKADTLEELDEVLTGSLNKNKNKTITIHWYWEYENTKEEDIQDTKDSQNIKDYNFTIYAVGEQII